MHRFVTRLTLLCCLTPICVGADDDLAAGKLLIASHELKGPVFEQSVVLLLQYDENGTVGLIVNRPMDVAPTDAVPELEFFEQYSGPLYFGGPVAPFEMRALLNSPDAIDAAVPIFDLVYLTPFDETLLERLPADASQLRFFAGYAGWSPGQLEQEMQRGSWHVRPATVELVFADENDEIWRQLVPPVIFQASN